jgi:hypothetical protein
VKRLVRAGVQYFREDPNTPPEHELAWRVAGVVVVIVGSLAMWAVILPALMWVICR